MDRYYQQKKFTIWRLYWEGKVNIIGTPDTHPGEKKKKKKKMVDNMVYKREDNMITFRPGEG